MYCGHLVFTLTSSVVESSVRLREKQGPLRGGGPKNQTSSLPCSLSVDLPSSALESSAHESESAVSYLKKWGQYRISGGGGDTQHPGVVMSAAAADFS